MSLFDRDTILTELRADRLMLLGAGYLPKVTLSDDYLWGRVVAAEADMARRLRVFLEPTAVFSGDPTQDEIDALSGGPYVVEPAYDYQPELFSSAWGALITRQTPIIGVDSMTFRFPVPLTSEWVVPPEWIRFDGKTGMVQLVPIGMAMGSSLSLFLMRLIGGGTMVPQMLRVRYRAGLQNALVTYPDLVDLIKRSAMLRVLNDRFLPQSGSISADGLSRSFSADLEKYQQQFDDSVNMLLDEIHGPRFAVM